MENEKCQRGVKTQDPWPVTLSNLDTSLPHRQRGAFELLTWEARYMIKFVFYPDDYGKKI